MNRHSEVGVAGGRPRAHLLGPTLIVLLFWVIQFYPVLFSHENLLGYRLLDPRYTGMAPENQRKSIFNRLPSQDASMLQTHFPFQLFLASQFHAGTFPLWNPLIGCGTPVTSDPQYKPFNPFFWPFFALPSAWMFSLGIALMALVGGVGYAVFLRRLDLGWAAVAFGGVLLTFNPLTAQTVVLSNPWAAWMFPWALVGADRWKRREHLGMPLAVAASAVMVYAGHPMSAVLHFAILLLYLWFPGGERTGRERLTGSILLGGGLAVLVAVHVLPTVGASGQYWSYKLNWDGGPYHHWLEFLNPKTEIYIPSVLWGLFFVGMLFGAKPVRWFFLTCAAYGAVVMLPWIGPGPARSAMTFGGLLVARYGAEAFWFGFLGLTSLAVHAFSTAQDFKEQFARVRLFAYGVAWYFGLSWASAQAGGLLWPMVYKRLCHWELAACIPALVMLLVPKRRRWLAPASAAFCVVVLALWQLPLPMSRYFSTVDLFKNPPAVVQAMSHPAGGGAARVTGAYYKLDLLADLCPNQGMCWGIPDIRITSPLILQHYREFSDHWNWPGLFGTYCFFPRQEEALLQFLGVRWVVADTSRPFGNLPEVRRLAPLALQEVSNPAPWVRAVGRWQVAANSDAAWRATFASIRSGSWREEAVLDANPGLAESNGNWKEPGLTWLQAGPNRWTWKVKGADDSLLLVLMNDNPGWRARVDGSPARIYRAYGTFMAVAVPAGSHEVSLAFRAPWFLVGAATSAIGWVALLAWIVVAWRRRTERHGGG